MNKLINNWKQYILKNHPVMWMSGLHLIIPVLLPVLILGYLWGYSNDFTSSLESTYIVGLIIGAVLLITIIAWQYYRFMKELSFLQLTKYFIFCIVIYFATIITAFSPLKGFDQKLQDILNDTSFKFSEELATKQISNFKNYLMVKGLNSFYVENECFFNEWKDQNYIEVYWTDPKRPIQRPANCPKGSQSFEEYIFNLTKMLSELNFDDPLSWSNKDKDHDGVIDVFDLCMDHPGSPKDYGCPLNNRPIILESTIEVLNYRIRGERIYNYPFSEDSFNNSIENIIKAADLIVNNGIDSLESDFKTSKFWPNDFKYAPISQFEPDADNIEQKQDIDDVFRKIQSNAYSNDRFNRDNTLLYTILILLIVVSIISSLIVTARFKVEAMLSPLLGFILWLVYGFLLDQVFRIRGDEIYFFFVIGPTILVFLYWIRNHKLKSITVFRSLLLHLANLSFITVLCFIWVWNDDDTIYENKIELAIILAVLAFLFNIFFLRQYHRHMHLPIKSK